MVLTGLVVFTAGEVLALFVFRLILGELGPPGPIPSRTARLETLKGILERAFLTIGLLLGYPGVLTVFAALKLANRLSHEVHADGMSAATRDRITNYFLIGNIVSVLFCLVYVWLIGRIGPLA